MSEVRACDGCTMCCKLLGVPELDKPALAWCTHCDIGVGCTVHAERPATCAAFTCGFLISPGLDERWRPSSCKIVLAFDEPAKRIYVHVERGDAWRKEPFYSQIKAWSAQICRQGGQVLVWQGAEVIAVLPHKDVNLGRLDDDQRIDMLETFSPLGYEYDVIVRRKGDPGFG